MSDAFDLELAQASEQGSQNWIDIRAGRFTASEFWKLVESGTREMNAAELAARPKTGKGSKSRFIEDPACLSKTTQTYIYQKVAETLTGHAAEPIFSQATTWGDTMEPIAAEYIASVRGWEYDILSFVPYGDHAGGSPDRKIKGTNEIMEIKCPYNSANQIHYLMLTDQWDLKREYPEHYWQCIANMIFTGADVCHFFTYDHRMIEDRHKLAYIEIRPVIEDYERIGIKLGSAIAEKQAILNLLK
jgi:hypothetical protein